MPHKVEFRVAAVSSEDDDFRAKELNSHGPTVQGWQSQRFCTYPQELIIELASRVRICKIQILSHQYLIASQIKICVGDTSASASAPSLSTTPTLTPTPTLSGLPNAPNLQNVKYKQLGYVALSENDKTNFKARELKSIHVDIVGTHVRFVLFKNHTNRQNVCNQVGIVAVNVIGDEAGSGGDIGGGGGEQFSDADARLDYSTAIAAPGTVRKKPDQISPLDDLTFDMYQDPEVAQIIRKLEAKKQEAIQNERYDYAKRLKMAVMDLYKAGETLGKYEIEKRQAIDSEAFDKARRKKAQMEDFRLRIYEQLELPRLLGYVDDKPTGVGNRKQAANRKSDGFQIEELLPRRDVIRTSTMALPPDGAASTSDDTVKRNNHAAAAAMMGSSRPIVSSYDAYEERVLPSLRQRPAAAANGKPEVERPSRATQKNMSEVDKREASLAIDIFGMPMVQLAYSKLFSDREEAMDDARQRIMDYEAAEDHVPPGKVMRAAAFLAHKGLRDIVLSVFTKTLALMTTLLEDFPKKHKVSKADVTYAVDKTLPELINKLGDKAQRQRIAAHLYIIEMVDFREVRTLPSVASLCCQPLSTQVQPRLAQGQAELVEQLVNKMGVDRSGGLALTTVMGFAVPALTHPSGPVRETAERIIANVYRERGPEVRRFLPSADTKKNMIYRQLFDTFDRIDSEASQNRRLSAASDMSDDGEATRLRRNSIAALSTRELEDRLEKVCIFCNEKNDRFTTEGLDLHYWRHCPMLIKCVHCNQVVEISGLTDHLLRECDAVADGYTKCKRCHEAIANKDYPTHNKLSTCTPAKREKGANRCPLCHKNIGPGEKGWRIHLMDKVASCEKNPRRSSQQQQQQDSRNPKISVNGGLGGLGIGRDQHQQQQQQQQQKMMKKSQSADRALDSKPDHRLFGGHQSNRISRSSTRTTMPRSTKWR